MAAEAGELPRPAAPPADVGPRRSWPAPMRGARAAFVFFSRLPLGGFPYRASDWHWAPAHLPLVGAVVGGLSAAVFLGAAALGLGPLLRASLALGAAVWLTGALHEDGLADSADGLGAAAGDPERALAIMKDSRIGTYGAVALIVSLLVRAAALAELARSAWFAIVFVQVWARVVPVWLLSSERYLERPDSKSQGLVAGAGAGEPEIARQGRGRHVLVALGWGGLAAALGVGSGWLSGTAALVVAAAALAPLPLLARGFRRSVGGITGDLLGAAEQIAELCAWIAASAILAH